MSSNAKRHYDLYSFSDEEFLAVVKDNLDAAGWVTSSEIADAIGVPDDAPNRLTGIGQRLGWMTSYGVLRKDTEQKSPSRWTLTGRGIVILDATFSSAFEKQLQGLKGEALWRLARTVTEQYDAADEVSASMVRRSFQRANYRRRHR